MQRAVAHATVRFVPEASSCPDCTGGLSVLKTRCRKIATLAEGEFTAHEVVKVCRSPMHPEPILVRSDRLLELVPKGQRFGWDVVVHVGLRCFLDHWQRGEILQELRSVYGITLSAGTVSTLCDRFLQRLEALHVDRADELRQAMEGGYVLHIDSTNETGKGGLFACLDGVRGWVLCCGRIETERTEVLEPVVQQTVRLFGKPVAVMRDMSKACAASVASLREQGVADFICHFHFIADIGSDLLERDHQRLKNSLKAAKVTTALRQLLSSLGGPAAITSGAKTAELAAIVYWTLNGDGRTPRFPFGLAHLDYANRVLSAPQRAAEITSGLRSKKLQQTVDKLQDTARSLLDHDAHQIMSRLEHSQLLFERLRSILRMEDRSAAREQPLLPEAEVFERARIKDELAAFEADLRSHARPRQLYDKSVEWVILDHLARYRDKLFGHPVVRDSQRHIIYVTARTNNVLESLFGHHKRGLRRRTGRRHLRRDLELLPPQALLAENLLHPTYVRALCGSLDHLPHAFASLDHLPTAIENLRPLHPTRIAATALDLLAQHIG